MDEDRQAKLTRDVYSQFSKPELRQIAEELEIDVDAAENTRKLAGKILQDLEENGIPEDLDEASDALLSLLVTAEYIDEEGNVLGDEEEGVTELIAAEDIPDWICFSYADPRDPSCNRCKLYEACWNKRVGVRPVCFGLQYSENDTECRSCIEAAYCKKEMNSNG